MPRWFARLCVGVGAGMSTAATSAFVLAATHQAPADQHHAASTTDLCYKKTWGVPWIGDWDNPTARGLPVQSRKVTRHIILIRHGQYANEKSSKIDTEHALTDLGKRQAAATGAFLRQVLEPSPGPSDLFPCGNVTALHVSDLTRARETCDIIAQELGPVAAKTLPIRVDPMLREIFPCDPQPAYSKKASPESERRIEEAYAKYFHRPADANSSTEIIVCHANVIRYFFLRAMQLPPEAWLRFSLAHCSVTSIAIDGHGRVKLYGYGMATHLAPNMQTTHNVA